MPTIKDYYVNVWPTDTDRINNPEIDTKYQEYKEIVKQDIERVKDKVDFLIVALCIFFIVKAMNKFKKKEEPKEEAPKTPEDVLLLREIRNLLKEKKK